eukprot:6183479-Pleurochrysis_carterae.AAC.2
MYIRMQISTLPECVGLPWPPFDVLVRETLLRHRLESGCSLSMCNNAHVWTEAYARVHLRVCISPDFLLVSTLGELHQRVRFSPCTD